MARRFIFLKTALHCSYPRPPAPGPAAVACVMWHLGCCSDASLKSTFTWLFRIERVINFPSIPFGTAVDRRAHIAAPASISSFLRRRKNLRGRSLVRSCLCKCGVESARALSFHMCCTASERAWCTVHHGDGKARAAVAVAIAHAAIAVPLFFRFQPQ